MTWQLLMRKNQERVPKTQKKVLNTKNVSNKCIKQTK